MRHLRYIGGGLALVLLLAACGQMADVGPSGGSTATASSPISRLALVEPVIIDGSGPGAEGGNRTCEDVGAHFGVTFEFSSDRINYEDGAFDAAFPAGLSVSTDGTFVSFSSSFAIGAVIVKGGPNANVYYYDPAVFEDTGLSSPDTPGPVSNVAGLSNITFCWNETPPPPDDDPELDPLRVSKTAYTKHRQLWTWDIEKHAQDEVVVAGEDARFAVKVTPSASGASVFEVWGAITVFNPNDEASATVESVTDELGGVAIDVDCGAAEFPYELAAGASLVCSYATTLDSGDTVKNVATATTSGDVEGGSGSVWVDFASHWGEIEEGMDYGSTNYCVDVVDNMGDASIHDQEELHWLARVCVVKSDPQTAFADGVERTMDGSTHILHYVIPTDAPLGATTAQETPACEGTWLVNRAKVLVYGGVGYVEATESVYVDPCPVGGDEQTEEFIELV
jgi:hypothetical protein